ncbi:MAG TPA: hypothetical protein VG842_11835, partial [Sediminibacterium sp.]|nr:hypothetical protein [Sediminibacterium sp.]
MTNRQDILLELQEISHLLAGCPVSTPYLAPAGFLEGLADELTAAVFRHNLIAKAAGPAYAVPERYFEGFAEQLMSQIRQVADHDDNELAAIAPGLFAQERTNPYRVPEAYFQPELLAEVVMQQPKAKVVTMRKARRWVQYAAAAVFAGVLISGAYLFTDDTSSYKATDNSLERFSVSSELEKLSDQDLMNYLNNPETFIAAPEATALASDADMLDVKNHIKQVSDEE